MPVGRDVQSFRAFVATWNVAGKSPHSGLNLDNILQVNNPSNVSVLGYADFDKIGQGGFGVVYYAKLTSEDDTKIVTVSGDQTILYASRSAITRSCNKENKIY
ncbi:hypothetical protein ABKV19_020709 [Rosa sericea]